MEGEVSASESYRDGHAIVEPLVRHGRDNARLGDTEPGLWELTADAGHIVAGAVERDNWSTITESMEVCAVQKDVRLDTARVERDARVAQAGDLGLRTGERNEVPARTAPPPELCGAELARPSRRGTGQSCNTSRREATRVAVSGVGASASDWSRLCR